MLTLTAAGWRNLLLTALPLGIGIGIVVFDSAWWGAAIGWGLLVAFLIVFSIVKAVRGRGVDARRNR